MICGAAKHGVERIGKLHRRLSLREGEFATGERKGRETPPGVSPVR